MPTGDAPLPDASVPDAPSRDAPVRDAATVVLLRDGPDGIEVFLLRRSGGMAFAAGMSVFPGGSVDPRDADAGAAAGAVAAGADRAGPPAGWARRLSASGSLARALLGAAVRETFEETGVLLAAPAGGGELHTDGPSWEAARLELEAGTLSLAALLARRRLVLRADLLRPWAHWITPVGEPRRYDTRFLVAALPAGQRTRHVGGEADASGWVRPADALAEADRGLRPLLPPTAVTLADLVPHHTVAAVLAAAEHRPIVPVLPVLRRTDAGAVVVDLPDGRRFPLRPAPP